ncbi:hypothetical protein [Nostoc sp.]|uniref:hypothetical protein n=1 Tax=Nostoc sp. TaxID=1180 RepID=UPI002FF80CC9
MTSTKVQVCASGSWRGTFLCSKTFNHQLEIVVVDVTESPIERPKKNIHLFYSGKKKQHTRLVISSGRPSEWSNISAPLMAKAESMIFGYLETVKLG